jgi:hypothetical protein
MLAQPQSYIITSSNGLRGPLFIGSAASSAVEQGTNSSRANGLPNAKTFYRDIAVFAFPTPAGDAHKMSEASPKVTASDMTGFDPAKLLNGNPKTAIILPRPDGGKPQFIQIEGSVGEVCVGRQPALIAKRRPLAHAAGYARRQDYCDKTCCFF